MTEKQQWIVSLIVGIIGATPICLVMFFFPEALYSLLSVIMPVIGFLGLVCVGAMMFKSILETYQKVTSREDE
jgi:hypothetical protein